PGALVRRREARDAARLRDDVLASAAREIARARGALAPAPVDGDGEASVTLPLDRFELAHPYGYGQPFVVGDRRLGLIGAETPCELHGLRRRALEAFPHLFRVHSGILPAVQCRDETARRNHHGISLGLVHDEARRRGAGE